jgi:hypothetical protein
MSDIVGGPFEVRLHDPWLGRVGPCQANKLFHRVVTSPARAKPVADALKPGFPKRFQGVFHHRLDASSDDGGEAQRALALAFGDIDPPDGATLGSVEWAELGAPPRSFFRGREQPLIDTRSSLAVVHLRHPAHTNEHVRPASQHQSLQRPDRLQGVVSRGPNDPLSEVPHPPGDLLPINRMPVQRVARSDVCSRLQCTLPPGFGSLTTCFGSIARRTSAPVQGTPYDAIRRVMNSPCLSACRPWLLAPSCSRCGLGPLLREGDWIAPDRHGGATFRIGKLRRMSWPLDAGSWAPSQQSR